MAAAGYSRPCLPGLSRMKVSLSEIHPRDCGPGHTAADSWLIDTRAIDGVEIDDVLEPAAVDLLAAGRGSVGDRAIEVE
jgi:hypothetical protein